MEPWPSNYLQNYWEKRSNERAPTGVVVVRAKLLKYAPPPDGGRLYDCD